MAGGSYDVVVDERPAEAPAAPSPRVVELAGLNGATPLEALALRARRDGRDVGALVAHIFDALKGGATRPGTSAASASARAC